jgi:hypothetical protein
VEQSALVQQAVAAMQVPLHSFCPDGHFATQVPLLHDWPVEQSASVQQALDAIQTPLQSFCPDGQDWQVPLTQTCPLGQVAPLSTTPSQSSSRPLQVSG